MPCYSPRKCYFSLYPNPSGKRSVIYSKNSGADRKSPVTLPCGSCAGCRLERSRQWAVRIMHEASLYSSNAFVTLTYRDSDLPADFSLSKAPFQAFMKALRNRLGSGIRYYYCGEYGEKFGRPHFHACLFNVSFPDQEPFKMSNGIPIFRSPLLEDCWPHGYSSIGTLTKNSAAYVSRYIMKKRTGPQADAHYSFSHPITGEVMRRYPEFNDMSRDGGIGLGWIEKYFSDVYPFDGIVMEGVRSKPPRFYDLYCEKNYPDIYASVCEKRKLNALDREIDSNSKLFKLVKARRAKRVLPIDPLKKLAIFSDAKIALLKRGYESDT